MEYYAKCRQHFKDRLLLVKHEEICEKCSQITEYPDMTMPVAEAAFNEPTNPVQTIWGMPVIDVDTPTDDKYNMLEMAWGLIANSYGGDWEKANVEWREAAAKWRDNYHIEIKTSRSAQSTVYQKQWVKND